MPDVRRCTLPDIDKDYINTEQAGYHLDLSPRTLEKYRTLGGGPRFHKFGRAVRYALADLDAWAAKRAAYMTSDPEYLALQRARSSRHGRRR